MDKIAKELVGLAKEVVAWGSRLTLPRSYYLQKANITDLKQYPTDTELGLEIWTYTNSKGFPAGIAFWGKSNKPLWNYSYRNQGELDRKIQETINSRKSHVDRVQQKRQERTQFRHTLKEGDILYSSWGYDQTQCDYYQVVTIGEKSVKVRRIANKAVDNDYVVAIPNHFTGPEMTKIVKPGNVINIASYANAYPWDGKPKYETPAGMGH